MALRNIHLHGDLARRFGPLYRLDVASAGEAGQALAAIVPGFRQHVIGRNFRVLRGDPETGMALGPEDLGFRLGRADLHIVPVPSGRGKGGMGKVIAGIFLIAATFFVPGLQGLTLFGGIDTLAVTKTMVTFGLGLTMTGLGMMLAPAPKMPDNAEDQSSWLFNGGPNVTTEGGPVPLVYGRKVRVRPVLIAAGLSTEDMAV